MRNEQAGDPAPSTIDYWALLRRRGGWLALGLVLGLAGGLGYSSVRPQEFTSSASVLVEQAGLSGAQLSNGRTSSSINLDTEAQLVTSAEVARRALRALGSQEPPAELADRVSVSVPPNSQILTITFTDTSAESAQSGAHEFATAYLDNRGERALAQVTEMSSSLQSRRDDLMEELRTTALEISSEPVGSAAARYATAQQSVLSEQLAALDVRIADLAGAGLDPGRIINDSSEPVTAGLGASALAVGGLGLGLFAGLGLALSRERLDRRVRDRREIENLLGAPVLAKLSDDSVDQASVGHLRNSILQHQGTPRRLLLFSDALGDATSPVLVRALADDLAQSGHKTLIIDTIVGTSGEGGLAEVLANPSMLSKQPASWPAFIPKPDRDGAVQELQAGMQAERLSQLISAPRASATVKRLVQGWDLVLWIGPSWRSPAAAPLTALTEGVVVVCGVNASTRESLHRITNTASAVHTPVIGAVVVQRRRSLPRLTPRHLPSRWRRRTLAPARGFLRRVGWSGRLAYPAEAAPAVDAGARS